MNQILTIYRRYDTYFKDEAVLLQSYRTTMRGQRVVRYRLRGERSGWASTSYPTEEKADAAAARMFD